MFLKCDPYRVWCSKFYSKLVNCILLRSLFVFVKGRGTCGSGERNAKIWINFRKSPRFSPTSPLSQVALFLLCVVSPAVHVSVLDLDTWTLHFLGYIACVLCVCIMFLTFVFKINGIIDTNYGKTTRFPNILETGTLLKHGMDRNENFRNNKKIILKTAIKSFESRRFFSISRVTANKQYFNLSLTSIKIFHNNFQFFMQWPYTCHTPWQRHIQFCTHRFVCQWLNENYIR